MFSFKGIFQCLKMYLVKYSCLSLITWNNFVMKKSHFYISLPLSVKPDKCLSCSKTTWQLLKTVFRKILMTQIFFFKPHSLFTGLVSFLQAPPHIHKLYFPLKSINLFMSWCSKSHNIFIFISMELCGGFLFAG